MMTAVTSSFNAPLHPQKPRFNRMVRRGFGSYLKLELEEQLPQQYATADHTTGDYTTSYL